MFVLQQSPSHYWLVSEYSLCSDCHCLMIGGYWKKVCPLAITFSLSTSVRIKFIQWLSLSYYSQLSSVIVSLWPTTLTRNFVNPLTTSQNWRLSEEGLSIDMYTSKVCPSQFFLSTVCLKKDVTKFCFCFGNFPIFLNFKWSRVSTKNCLLVKLQNFATRYSNV